MKKLLAILSVLVIISTSLIAQELDCNIQISHRKIQGTNTQVFESMRKDIFEFMNNRIWTEHIYTNEERIECNILINIETQVGSDRFLGTITVQSSRPIYNSAYSSPMLNFQERDNDLEFDYIEGEPLDFNENTFLSSLSSVLSFYAYIIIGYDYDSYSKNGGDQYFQKAQMIMNNAKSNSKAGKGWQAYESRQNRFWLIDNLLDAAFDPFHECLYMYHRLGLDVMNDKVEGGRAQIAESMRLIQKVHRKKPSSFVMDLFFTAKSDELVNVFSESFNTEKQTVYNLLKEVNPSNATKYQKIISNK